MPLIGRIYAIVGALSLMMATQLSAYGFHGLTGKVTPAKLSSWEWAVQLQFVHSLGLIAVALLLTQMPRSVLLRIAGALMIIGQLLFCATLYANVLGAPPGISQVAPLGGGSFMVGWLLTAAAVLRLGRD
jgi:uncharacterized membrane protein YgdD (TMEM256/DUF423 family)